jgi:hypothetical protein
METEKLEALLHIGGERRFEFHQLAGGWMLKFECVGMQRGAVDDRVFGDCLGIF